MPEHIRPLDAFESMQCMPDPMNDFTLGLAMEYKGQIEPAALRTAFSTLQQRYSCLRVSIQERNGGKYYSSNFCSPIQITVVDIDDNMSWQTEAQDSLHCPFPKHLGQLLRCKLVRSRLGGTLIIVGHHVILDGSSLTHLARELLSILADGSKPRTATWPEQRFLPSLAQIIGSPPPDRHETFCTWKHLTTPMPVSNAEPWPNRTGIVFRTLDEVQTGLIRTAAKSRGVGIQGVLTTALLHALDKRLSTRQNLGKLQLHYECPVDLRRFLGDQIQPDDLGCYFALTQFNTRLQVNQARWDTAKHVETKLQSQLGPDLPYKSQIAVENLVKNHDDFATLKHSRDPNMPFVGVSNLGKVDLPDHQNLSFRVTSFYPLGALHGTFYQENNVYALVAGAMGKMFLSILYPRPHMSTHRANALADDFLTELKLMTRTARSTKRSDTRHSRRSA